MKNTLIITTLIVGLVSIAGYSFAAGTLDTETVSTSVKVDTFQGITLYEADGTTKIASASTRDFSINNSGGGSTTPYTPKPGETSWYSTSGGGTADDGWYAEPSTTVDSGQDDKAPSRIAVQCVYNSNPTTGIWYLKVKGTQLTSGTTTIPLTVTVGSNTYAYYGWVPSISGESGSIPSDQHKYTHGGMKPYSTTDETAYTSGTGELGAKVSIWTGIQIPIDQAPASTTPYTSTVTFTLAN